MGVAFVRGSPVYADRCEGRVQMNQSVPATVAAIMASSAQGIPRVMMAQLTSGTIVRVEAYFQS